MGGGLSNLLQIKGVVFSRKFIDTTDLNNLLIWDLDTHHFPKVRTKSRLTKILSKLEERSGSAKVNVQFILLHLSYTIYS